MKLICIAACSGQRQCAVGLIRFPLPSALLNYSSSTGLKWVLSIFVQRWTISISFSSSAAVAFVIPIDLQRKTKKAFIAITRS